MKEKALYRQSVRTQFTRLKLPKNLSTETIEALLVVAKQSERARDDLIIGHVHLVLAIASRFIAKYSTNKKYMTPDLIAVGLLTLVQCVNRVVNGEHVLQSADELPKYINKSVKYEIQSFIKTDNVVVPPLQSAWLEKLIKDNGTDVLAPLFHTVEYQETVDTDNPSDRVRIANGSMRNLVTSGLFTPDCKCKLLLQDILSTPYLTSREQAMLQMRADGDTIEEIAKVYKISKNQVSRILRERIGPIMVRILSGDLA